jgi:hypothetical protein
MMLLPQASQAGSWLSSVSIITTLSSFFSFFTGSDAVRAACGTTQLMGLMAASTLSQSLLPSPDPGRPVFLTGTAPAPFPDPPLDFPLIPINPPPPPPKDTKVIQDANKVIQSGDALFASILANASARQIRGHEENLSVAFKGMATDIALLGFDVQLTQSDLNTLRAQVQANGLPSYEQSYLASAGWTSAQIAALGTYVGQTDLELAPAATTVSLSQSIHEMARQTNVPDSGPTALLLALGGGFIWFGRRLLTPPPQSGS